MRVGRLAISILHQWPGHAATFAIFALLMSPGPVSAQQLSIRHYSVSDGLAHSCVRSIYQDKKGYLWFGTNEGVSRFDGYRFTNYGTRDGLANSFINGITEDREGRIWVATNGGGVSRFIDDPQEAPSLRHREPASAARQKFIGYPVGNSTESNRVNRLLFDAEGRLWCATDVGLYRGIPGSNGEIRFEVIAPHEPSGDRMAAFADSQGRLWFGVANDMIEVVQDHIITYGPSDEVGRLLIISIIEDRQGRLLAANQRELFEFIAPTGSGRGRWRRFPLELKANSEINSMLADATGSLWIGTNLEGLIKYKDGKQTFYTTAQGLTDNHILASYEDRDGNLWIGTVGAGVCKLSGDTLISYTRAEGLAAPDVHGTIEDREGRVFVFTNLGSLAEVFEDKAVPIEGSQSPRIGALDSRILQDDRGDWWIGTNRGLLRFQGPGLQLRRGKKLTLTDGVPEETIWVICEDQARRVWVVLAGPSFFCLDPAQKGRAAFEPVAFSGSWPSKRVIRMMSDRSGALWLGEYGMLGRLKNGSIELLQPTDGLPETDPRAFFQDSRGWLWIGQRYKGVSMTKDPTANAPKFVNYSTENGLASDTVWTITEDDFGRMYFGTGKGLDRLDVSTGRMRHFTTTDGLAGDQIHHCIKDRRGNIWVATITGLSKLNPRAERVISRAPPIYLARIEIAGEDLPIAETGIALVPGLELSASRNNLLIEFVGLDFHGERALKYQYQLEGADQDWSPPTEQRSVNYARLAPGSYRFLVRAINQEGITSEEPAALQFRILPPIWQRWWFLALTAILIGLGIYATHRYRVARLIELERVRTRIASDLHDDIGSNLSVIAGLSDVLRRQAERADSPTDARLSLIAAVSQRSLEAISDIVWAVNPKKDHLLDLTQRLRLFADEALFAHNIEFEFSAPHLASDKRIGAETRREVFLIFKEAVNNIVRHSGCAKAEATLQVDHKTLVLLISDDGRGFDPTLARAGEGLASMRRRAEKIDGEIEVVSRPGDGATIRLKAPLR